MNLGNSIRNGAKWLAMGNIGQRLLEFAFGIILARLLVPADFGMILTIQAFTGFVGMFASGGMGQALIRSKKADAGDFTAVFTMQLTIGLLVYAIFFFTAPLFANYFDNPLYADLIRVSALSFLLRPFTAMRNAWLNRQMEFKLVTYIKFASGIFTGVISTLMAFLGMGVWSLILSGLIGTFTMNVLLSRITPFRLRLNYDLATMRKHSAFGIKITINNFITYLRSEAKHLIISKLAGPSFLGLFNKAESMSRLPNQMLVPATMQPLFRAMSKMQDDLDQTKYLFYRTITLLMFYTTPIYVLLWWIAEPFIGVVYGEKWIQAGAPMSILATAGIFLNIIYPCSVMLDAQNKLGQQMLAQSINLLVIVSVCIYGLNWGLEGVATGIVFSHFLMATHYYWLAQRALPARIGDLFRAAAPGLSLSALLLVVLTLIDLALGEHKANTPVLYLLVMSFCGGLFYAAAFLLIPIPALQSEATRWRQKFGDSIALIRKALP